MSKLINSLDGMSIKDLMSEDGLIIDVSEEMEEHADEPYKWKSNVTLSDNEIIKFLNMEEFGHNDDESVTPNNGETMMPWSLSFDKIKLKSTPLMENGKIMKLVRQKGVGEVVSPDSLVILHYGGYFEHQDEPFDSTFARGGPDKFHLNQGELIWGLEIAIKTMKKHETACFILHPDYAYGEFGCMPLVPPNAEVLFIVHVHDVIEGGSAQNIENLTPEERRQFKNIRVRANGLIHTANESFKRNKTRQAIREYSRAAALLERAGLDNEEEEQELNRLLSRIYGNLAICYNKEDKPRMACKSCLTVPNPTAKTYFHHGRALLKMGEYKQALEKLHHSLKLDQGNVSTCSEIQMANDLQRKYLASEKRIWENCLKVRKDKQEIDEYANIAKEFCETFAENKAILRQPFPEGLTPDEDKRMREEASRLGLTVLNHVRYGKDITYLAKSTYMTAL